MRRTFVAVIACAALFMAPAAGQKPDATLRILSPENGGYATEEVVIKADIDLPADRVDRMIFFVDGHRICTVERPPFECMWDAGSEIREHLFRVKAYLHDGGRAVQIVRTKGDEYAYHDYVDSVLVTVTVLDGSAFARGLSREAFHVYEDDVLRPITHFERENIPLEMVAGVDVSGSMKDAIGEMRKNIASFRSDLPPRDRVTLLAFNENYYVLARPSMDLAAKLAAVGRLDAWGSTALHDVLYRSFEMLGRQPGRRAIVLFTDGDDTSSLVTREAVERRAETSDAVLYLIGQGEAIRSKALRQLCERLAQKSGGRAFFPETLDNVHDVFGQIREELASQYLLGYAPRSTKHDSAWHRIRVEVEADKNQLFPFQVRARQGYRFRTPG